MEKFKRKFNCECGEKSGVVLEEKHTRNGSLMKVCKCSSCKRQYGLKQLLKLEEVKS